MWCIWLGHFPQCFIITYTCETLSNVITVVFKQRCCLTLIFNTQFWRLFLFLKHHANKKTLNIFQFKKNHTRLFNKKRLVIHIKTGSLLWWLTSLPLFLTLIPIMDKLFQIPFCENFQCQIFYRSFSHWWDGESSQHSSLPEKL